MEKLKNRLDAFADAIMAVIITIMVLSIEPVLHDSWANYLILGKHIGIFLISFIFVANIWYQHAAVFSEIETMTYRIVISDLLFLAFLALIPLFTNMMTANTTKITVLAYGALQLLVNLMFRHLSKLIVHLQYTDKSAMQKVYRKIYGNANLWLDALATLALVVAWVFPRVALVFYLAYPILMFLLNARARQEMYDVETLPEAEQEDVASFNTSEMKDFRKAQQAIMNPSAPGDADATSAVNWQRWLDQSIDPKKRERLLQRYGRATPEQQARLQEWFADHHRGQRHSHRDQHDHH
ncbi:TMEM175 family protein [Lacticaseibacillus sp. N501-2]|uniref:TMEM175 family protein n=1 Tax=Lacticaseibacillus salsurae TaxID=3367729 RepID=UPI0038B2F093